MERFSKLAVAIDQLRILGFNKVADDLEAKADIKDWIDKAKGLFKKKDVDERAGVKNMPGEAHLQKQRDEKKQKDENRQKAESLADRKTRMEKLKEPFIAGLKSLLERDVELGLDKKMPFKYLYKSSYPAVDIKSGKDSPVAQLTEKLSSWFKQNKNATENEILYKAKSFSKEIYDDLVPKMLKIQKEHARLQQEKGRREEQAKKPVTDLETGKLI
jgi:hypothetical protein